MAIIVVATTKGGSGKSTLAACLAAYWANGQDSVEALDTDPNDFGAEIREWSDFALSRRGQAIRRETGMPMPVMMFSTLQATLASVFCVGRVRAWRPRPITFLYRNIATSANERFP
jgi:adenylylsulfate kinase-like enzyme